MIVAKDLVLKVSSSLIDDCFDWLWQRPKFNRFGWFCALILKLMQFLSARLQDIVDNVDSDSHDDHLTACVMFDVISRTRACFLAKLHIKTKAFHKAIRRMTEENKNNNKYNVKDRCRGECVLRSFSSLKNVLQQLIKLNLDPAVKQWMNSFYAFIFALY